MAVAEHLPQWMAKFATEFSCEGHTSSPRRKGSYLLVLKHDIFHLSFFNVLHSCYNISLLIKEAAKHWRQSYTIEGKILVEYPMAG